MAIDVLGFDPFIEGDYYPGDLLNSVLSVNGVFWKQHPAMFRDLAVVVDGVQSLWDTLNKDIMPAIARIRAIEVVE